MGIGKGREGNGRAYPWRMLVAGEAPDEELAGGATRPVVAAMEGRDRDRLTEREEGEKHGWEKRER